MKRLKTIADEDDPLMKAVYELQFSLEGAIETLKIQRADFANAVAILQEQRRREVLTVREGRVKVRH